MSKGTLTSQVAHLLHEEFNPKGFDVLHDHRQTEVDSPDMLGKLRSWFGPDRKNGTGLADLDIAIVSHDEKEIYALVEVEETTDTPKVILGDVLAILLGSGIVFLGEGNLKVGNWTTLIVMVSDKNQTHCARLAFLADQINILKKNLTTPNASIGLIIIDSFTNQEDLEKKLRDHILAAVSQRGS